MIFQYDFRILHINEDRFPKNKYRYKWKLTLTISFGRKRFFVGAVYKLFNFSVVFGEFLESNPDIRNVWPLYDGRHNVYTATEITGVGDEPFPVSLTEDGRTQDFEVAFQRANVFSMQDLPLALNVLDLAVREAPSWE